VRAELSSTVDEQVGLRAFPAVPLPSTVARRRAGHTVTAYPALVDEGDTVAVRAFETAAEQRSAMAAGFRRLVLLNVPSPVKLVNSRLTNQAKLALNRNPHRNAVDLLDDCVACAVDKIVADHGGPSRDETGFARLCAAVRAALPATTLDVVEQVQRILAASHSVRQRLAAPVAPAHLAARADIGAQLDALIYRGFVTATGWDRLPDLPRYLHAVERRLDKLPENPARDRQLMLQVQQIERDYRQLRTEVPPGEGLDHIRWMIEELRVSYFAQALGTAYPVSDKRIFRAMDDLTG
jgi:ATP-dependent helicase HrpA